MLTKLEYAWFLVRAVWGNPFRIAHAHRTWQAHLASQQRQRELSAEMVQRMREREQAHPEEAEARREALRADVMLWRQAKEVGKPYGDRLDVSATQTLNLGDVLGEVRRRLETPAYLRALMAKAEKGGRP